MKNCRRYKPAAGLFLGLELQRSERVAVYLEKRLDTVVAMFGASAAGVPVPVNPLPAGAGGHILNDSKAFW
jgi:acyl-CoA synthetase (AMP-forming)/AMP-acid ligase II